MIINLLRGMKNNRNEEKDTDVEMMLSFLTLTGVSGNTFLADEIGKTDLEQAEIKITINGIELDIEGMANRLIGIFNEKQKLENKIKEINA